MARHTGRTGERGGPVMHQAITPATAPPAAPLPRWFDAGTDRVSGRDIAGLTLCGEMYGAPSDLLAADLNVQPDRLRGIVARWRAAGYAEPGQFGPGPAWCWPTRPGLAAMGLWFAAGDPSPGRLAHLRAVLAARLALESSPAGLAGQPWWRSERCIRAAAGGPPAVATSPTPKPAGPRFLQPLPGGTVGHRGRRLPRGRSPAPRPSWPTGCTAAPATTLARSHRTGPAMTGPSTPSAPPPAASSPAPPPRSPHSGRPG